ncbi:MAG: response regulator [Nitrospira sp.]|nr:response regulator [bacterium]MBL7048760.1 response regulator [Nitrospira sp.]
MTVQIEGTIIVVDDDPYVLETAAALLREYGYNVIPCNNGPDAVEKALTLDTRLILTDIKMPGMSGIQLLEKVHAILPAMPIILMTGYAELDVAIAAIKKGAFDFITKPYNPEYLIDTVEKARRYCELLQVEQDYKQRLEETVRKQTREIFNLSREVIRRLTSVAEFRDVETGSHISRIGLYANKISEYLNKNVDFIDAITYASTLHDIGKIGIPDNILLKPGTFTREEFDIMKSHTTIGHKILADSPHPILQMASTIALQHHERWDGSGYPNGLKGSDIPLEGRIVIICDQYDALRCMRPYKSAITHEDVCKILIEGDGRTMPKHFDPDILSAFTELSETFREIYDSHQDGPGSTINAFPDSSA